MGDRMESPKGGNDTTPANDHTAGIGKSARCRYEEPCRESRRPNSNADGPISI